MKKILKYCPIVLFLSIVVCVNVNHFIYELCKFYSFNEPKVNKILEGFLYSDKIYPLLNLTGLETGYGFFSPNVASSYTYQITSYSNGKKSINNEFLPIKNKESLIRLATAFGTLQYFNDSNHTNVNKLRTKILLNGIGKFYLKQTIYSIEVIAFLINKPTLKSLSESPLLKNDYIFITKQMTYKK